MAPLGRQYDQIEGMRALDFEPARSPASSLVGCIQRLRHQPFVTGCNRRIVEGACCGRRGSHQTWNPQRLGNRLREKSEALLCRGVDDGVLAKTLSVEEKGPGGQLVHS